MPVGFPCLDSPRPLCERRDRMFAQNRGDGVYENHFGLRSRPFDETTSPAACIELPSRAAVLRRLCYGLEHRRSPAVLFGPSGSGKTLIAGVLASRLGSPSVHVTYPALPAEELLIVLTTELCGQSPEPRSMATALSELRGRLASAAKAGLHPLLIVDEAQLIADPASFDVLRLLLNFSTAGPPDLNLLLVGTAEMLPRIPLALADRVTARCLLLPFTQEESAAYVAGRLTAAGATTPLFSADALAGLHRAADGLPRRLNHLADLALLIAYAEGRTQAEAHTITIAAREFQLDDAA